MELTPVDEVPAAKRGGGRRGSKWDEVVTELMKNPGQWFIVLETESRPTIQGAHRYLTTQYTDKVEAKSRTNPDGKFVLYARSV